MNDRSGARNASKNLRVLGTTKITSDVTIKIGKKLDFDSYRPYNCRFCAKSYFRNYLLTRHILKIHKQNNSNKDNQLLNSPFSST